MGNERLGVDILPNVADQGALGAADERWEAVYANKLYTLNDAGELIDVANTFALRDAVGVDTQRLYDAVAQLNVDLTTKADVEHGVHLAAPLNNQPTMFLRSDNTWAEVSTETINAPTATGGGASGLWDISISGNAVTADSAVRDGANRVITSTYLHNLEYTNDGRLKLTRGDGVSYEIYREITPAGIGAPTVTGAGASGLWNIDVSGNAVTANSATVADEAVNLRSTAAQNRTALVVGLDGVEPITDAEVYLTSSPGTLHATRFEGTVAALSDGLTANSVDVANTMSTEHLVVRSGLETGTIDANIVTANRFIGTFDGVVTEAVLAREAKCLQLINDNERRAFVVAQSDQQAYYDTGIYFTETPGQLHVTSLQASSVTAATFTGALAGNATTANTATLANTVTVTDDATRKATVLAHVNGKVYADTNVYLTVNSGQLHVNSLTSTSIETASVTSSGEVFATQLTLAASAPRVDFKWNSSGTVTHTLRPTSASLLSCSTEFTATKCYNAVWNDYAEFFEQGADDVRPGDLVALTDDGDERYARASSTSSVVVGVCSDEYGHAVGGLPAEPGKTVAETNAGKFVAVALAGRVWASVRGPVQIGDRIVPSAEPGVGVASDDRALTAVGRAVTAKMDAGLGKVRIIVQLGAQ